MKNWFLSLKRGAKAGYICPLLLLFIYFLSQGECSTFNENYAISWGGDHVKLSNDGQTAQLLMDRVSGSGFASKNQYLFGSFNMKIKLVPGNSAGTVTAYYMSSDSSSHDEVDFEFLGNLQGKDYILQTNVFAGGVGNREQRIRLWFDPSADFHNYSILWNQKQIVFGVDSIPIRVFKNNEGVGVAYLKNQPMKIISTLWNGEDWATDGGKMKIDWSKAPFIASYQAFEVDGCMASAQSCSGHWWEQPEFQGLSQNQLNGLKWVERNYMLYDYCKDKSGRFSSAPPECAINP
ncbi:hypothetical protein SUGI_0382660 [Cryptomeria japonica]|uniref:probable xyloglucan endotransglucosylase/hydrolase protein 5 n=1 Tax=Cryptomeria japonica TaxID=3369 RepID=UPI002408B20C|nr:probable xyloglucan endotransglucosylase/hydrolase protein 5 [Cryptomeria japonica]GLJ20954.1 hypothetical protein SUGI_0382660 [Cryptomeria japonica]